MNPKAIIQVKVLPRSSKDQIVGQDQQGIFKLKLTAPPVQGRANKALKEFLSKRLGVAKTNIEIISGERLRLKTVQISGLASEDVDRLLAC
jgi:uncharacterized protein (TIGR00251 family)